MSTKTYKVTTKFFGNSLVHHSYHGALYDLMHKKIKVKEAHDVLHKALKDNKAEISLFEVEVIKHDD